MRKFITFLLLLLFFSSCGIFVSKRNSTPLGPEVIMKYFDGNGKPTGYKPRSKKELKEYKDVQKQLKEDQKIQIKKEAISNY